MSKEVQQNMRSYLVEPREKEVFDRPTAAAGTAKQMGRRKVPGLPPKKPESPRKVELVLTQDMGTCKKATGESALHSSRYGMRTWTAWICLSWIELSLPCSL